MALLRFQVRGTVEQRRATANMQSSAGAVVKALLAAKASGDLPGVYGRLGALNQSYTGSVPANPAPKKGIPHLRFAAMRIISFVTAIMPTTSLPTLRGCQPSSGICGSPTPFQGAPTCMSSHPAQIMFRSMPSVMCAP